MVIKLYNTASENIRIEKVLTGEVSLTGNLKDECSIKEPVVLVEGIHINKNYAYIPEFNRYYYVLSDTKIVRGNITELHLRCDPLKSFASEIKALPADIERSETIYDIYLPDPEIKAETNYDVVTHRIGDKSFTDFHIIAGFNTGICQPATS